jgi:ADP-ribose pyrophosphatase YjhB (NUDIX family)
MTYQIDPPDFSPKLAVVGMCVVHNGKLLLLHRHPEVPQGGTWSLPGGKVEKETLQQAASRELAEETDIHVKPSAWKHVKDWNIRYPQYDYTYHVFEVELHEEPKVHLQPRENVAFKFVTPIEAVSMKLAPGEAECIKYKYLPQAL